MTDSENFYFSLLEVLQDEDESENLQELLRWWNQCVPISRLLLATTDAFFRKIFPYSSPEVVLAPIEGSALQRIRQKRAEAKAADGARDS